MWTHDEAHPGEYLRNRFLEPLHLTASALAAECGIPRSRVSALLSGDRGISPDTAARLAAFFRMEPEQWMALQADFDLQRASQNPEIAKIKPLDPPGFLLGPLGATPIPVRRPSRPVLAVPNGSKKALADDNLPEGSRSHAHVEVRYRDGTRAMVAKPE